MKAVLYCLFGWSFTTATAWALGVFLLRAIRLRLHRSEEIFLGFVTGASILSALIFALCSLHLVHKGVFLALGIVALGLAVKTQPCNPPETPPMPVPRMWKWVFALIFATFAFLYFINALAPETSPDGAAYHIPIAAIYYRAHGFERTTWDMYFTLSQGIELLFLMAFSFGRHSAAALTHFSFLLALPFLIAAYGRRFGFAAAGVAAALIVFVSPVVGRDGSCAYIDVALTAIVFGMFYFLQLWHAEANSRLLIPAGLLAGFAFAAKYTAIVAAAYAILFVAWTAYRRKLPVLRPVVLVASLASLMMAPWLLKNWLFVGNPFAPFENSLFPNPYFHISAEHDYREYLKKYDLTSYREIPLELTIRGEKLAGLYGPFFLLAPLALLGLRQRAGRQLLLASALIGSTYFTNIGARLLMPVIPFVALALVLLFQNYRLVLLILTIAQAILCWPWVLGTYCSRYAWRLNNIPIAQAFRKEPENHYLERTSGGYVIDRMLEDHVGPDDKVFSFGGIAEAYTSRRLVIQGQGALGELLGDILQTAQISEYQPRHLVDFHFFERQVRKMRVVQTARLAADQWDVSEVRIFDKGVEIPRDPHWRLLSHPNPWDVQLAFDNALATRWRSWQPAQPGMFLEIDFGAPLAVDGARIETSDWDTIKMRLEGTDPSGEWKPLSSLDVWTERKLPQNLRRSASEEFKRRGIRFLLIAGSDFRAGDFFRHSDIWGWKQVAQRGTTRLYYIE